MSMLTGCLLLPVRWFKSGCGLLVSGCEFLRLNPNCSLYRIWPRLSPLLRGATRLYPLSLEEEG